MMGLGLGIADKGACGREGGHSTGAATFDLWGQANVRLPSHICEPDYSEKVSESNGADGGSMGIGRMTRQPPNIIWRAGRRYTWCLRCVGGARARAGRGRADLHKSSIRVCGEAG